MHGNSNIKEHKNNLKLMFVGCTIRLQLDVDFGYQLNIPYKKIKSNFAIFD